MTLQMRCPFEEQDDGTWKCPQCGIIRPTKRNKVCPEVRKKMPTLIEQGRNLTKAVIEAAAAKAELCTPDEYSRRLQICDACEFKAEDHKKGDRCTQCGCYLKFKAKFEVFECPLGKWNKG